MKIVIDLINKIIFLPKLKFIFAIGLLVWKIVSSQYDELSMSDILIEIIILLTI